MSWLADLLARKAAQSAVDYVGEAIQNGKFDEAIGGVIADTVRNFGDDGLTRTGFLLKITVELIDYSVPPLSFVRARAMANEIYTQFRRDNDMVKFGTPDWDWSGEGARTLAHEYEIQHWEPAV